MIVLALDTAGIACQAALFDAAAGKVLGQASEEIGRGHAERLMEMIDAALLASGLPLEAVDRIAVTIGPGSFTGIRVGVAAARGLALALGKPCVGISILEALARAALPDAGGRAILSVLDAKREELYLQVFSPDGSPRAEPQAVEIMSARAEFAGFEGLIVGSGAGWLTGAGPAARPDVAEIGVVAALGAKADPQTALPKPLYLRGPDVRSQAGFAVARA
ncbi:tRNA (adenosine(37)-N6)-threonylcarbamoyltransferase complex dimerization subunit type 1 TsaB [Rhizobium sp. YIM 134829]|uniref:tRNA (adenosine(37)-N6)-threonylcarbamoyltransferase complex dimerization subunit type 1 TsaB n=1 Tax=Rhizobium sp. YIM 134829 TaxID=3390453 RepID=UPI003979FA7A